MRKLRRTSWLFLAAVVVLVGCRKDEEIKVYRVAKGEPAPQAVAPADPHAGMNMPAPGAASAPQAPADQSAPSPAARKTVGTVPEGWQAGGGSAMRRASFKVAGEDGAMADVSLIILSGPAGGAVANINRWRGQFGLKPLETEDLEREVEMLETKCGQAMVVDLAGIAPGADPKSDGRMVAAIVERGGATWFFKMRGNAEVVGKEKPRFLDWVKSVEPAEVESR
jgi:hypothetical protein